ncbi:MAG: FHA domain-containing protein [Planctomycetaceae bacterium]|jgi:hypothetical protein|nr:FHA domain-containing protein [Planctomycetaceae bacterium]MBT6156618.1 FHA domain-containing protein [Planctomycetaceae bacterium]MBT6483997.1 FHA domain-containing protein [Planctomycetaceae bacterium]MBT6496300.1 FHA domain-containing protein [Planctomycetaceae bacterium]
MASVTIQVIEGLERGHVYSGLVPPVSIGREDDNLVRLNDERVSRFHAKLQEDGDRIILTDLDSTNGTRVNGHPVQMRVMQIGDQVSVGRCLLIFGSRDEIAARLEGQPSRNVGGSDAGSNVTVEVSAEAWESGDHLEEPIALEEPSNSNDDESCDTDANLLAELFPDGPPSPPRDLRPIQRAEVSDMLAFVHEQIRTVLQSASEELTNERDAMKVMRVAWPAWQRLLNLEMDLAVYLKKIADPDE